MTATLFDFLLCGLIFAAAVIAVAGRELFSAVVFFIVYGALVATAWIRLGAVDVALAEAAIGAGLTGILLLGALGRFGQLPKDQTRAVSPLQLLLTAGTTVVISLLLAWNFLHLPQPETLHKAVKENLAATGVENPITAVLLNFRAWDTLLESLILLTALLGVWVLARDNEWNGRPGLRQHTRPGGVMASFGRVLPSVGLLIGVYLVWAGGYQPGGAFQGGTVLAAVGLLVVMAGLTKPPYVRSKGLRIALVGGPLLFLCVGLAGAVGGHFLVIPASYAKYLTLMIEAGLAISIAVTLFLLVLGPPGAADMKMQQGDGT